MVVSANFHSVLALGLLSFSTLFCQLLVKKFSSDVMFLCCTKNIYRMPWIATKITHHCTQDMPATLLRIAYVLLHVILSCDDQCVLERCTALIMCQVLFYLFFLKARWHWSSFTCFIFLNPLYQLLLNHLSTSSMATLLKFIGLRNLLRSTFTFIFVFSAFILQKLLKLQFTV